MVWMTEVQSVQITPQTVTAGDGMMIRVLIKSYKLTWRGAGSYKWSELVRRVWKDE